MRALFYSIVWMSRVGHFAWMAGWGMWLLSVTWCMFAGGDFWIPFTFGGLTMRYGVFLWGLLMLIVGVPLGMTIAHFGSVLLRLPGALVCTAIARSPENQDLMATSRGAMR